MKLMIRRATLAIATASTVALLAAGLAHVTPVAKAGPAVDLRTAAGTYAFQFSGASATSHNGGAGLITLDGSGGVRGVYTSVNDNQPAENGTLLGTYALHVNAATGMPDGTFDLNMVTSGSGHTVTLNAVFGDRGHVMHFVETLENGAPNSATIVGWGNAT